MPALQNAIDVCIKDLPEPTKAFVTSFALPNIEKVTKSIKKFSDYGHEWLKTMTIMEEWKIKENPDFPPLENFGSLVSVLRTLDISKTEMVGRYGGSYKRDEKIVELLDKIDEVEKKFLNKLLGLENVTFGDFVYALGPSKPMEKLYDDRTGTMYYIGKNITDDNFLKFDRSMRKLLMGILSNGIALPSGESMQEAALLSVLKEKFPEYEPASNERLFPSLIPFCLSREDVIGKDVGFENLPVCDQITPVLTDTGICFSFNAKNSSGVFRNINETGSIDWPGNNSPHKVDEGAHNGFTLVIDINLHKDVNKQEIPGIVEMDMEGDFFKIRELDVMLSNFGTVPITRRGTRQYTSVLVEVPDIHETDDVYIQKYNIEITALVTQVSEDARVLTPEMRDCLFEDEGDLELFNHYSTENCMLECKLRETEKECSCIPWNYLAFSNSEICSPLGNVCFSKAMSRIGKSITVEQCGCKRSCNEIQYSYDLANVEKVPIVFQSWVPIEPNELLYMANYTQQGMR